MAAECELNSDGTCYEASSQAEPEQADDEVERETVSEAEAPSSSSTALSVRKGTYKEHCEESFRELKDVVTSSVAEFVENTTMSDVVEVLEEEKVLDRLKSSILDHL